jgi:hypothetical protein
MKVDPKWLRGSGKLVYNPHRPDLRKTRQADDWWLVVNTDNGIGEYYRWWIKKMKGIELLRPAWRTHVSILNGREPVQPEYLHLWKKYQNKPIHFEYSVDIEQHWKFFVLPVRCEELVNIRGELGLSTKKSPLHITIGRLGDS